MPTPATTETAAAPRSLAEWLRGRSDAELVSLLNDRPDLALPAPADVGVLASRSTVRVSLARALDRLTRFQAEVLEAFALLPQPASVDDLLDLLAGVDPAALLAALDRLRSLALVWGDPGGPAPTLHLPRAVRDALPLHPLGLGRPVADLVGQHGRSRLEPVLRAWGVEPPGSTVAARDRLIGGLLQRGHVCALVADTDREAAGVLERLSAGPPFGQFAGATAAGGRDHPVRRLLRTGLLVATDPDTVELPREVGLALRGDRPAGVLHPEPPAMRGREEGVKTVDAAGGAGAAALVRHLEALLETLGTEPATALRTGGLGVRDLRRVAQEVGVDDGHTALLLELGYAAGLLDQTAGVETCFAPTPSYDEWLAAPPGPRWARVAAGWLGSPRWAGLVGQRDDRDKLVAALAVETVRPGVRDLRRQALGVLAELPPGQVPGRDGLAAALAWSSPRRAGGRLGPVVTACLTEAEMLGVTGRGGITTAGRALLRGDLAAAARAVARQLPEPVAEVLLQADLTAVAPGPLVPELAREMALLADVESSGGATVYRFSETSLRRALDAGRGADEVKELLARVSRTPVPQGLGYLVDDVARRHGALRVGTASAYLRCDDPVLMAEVLAARKAATLHLRRLAPTVAVTPTDPKRLLEVLRAAGYSPTAESADGALVVARAERVRTPLRPRPEPVGATGLDEEQVSRVVGELRAGDEAWLAAEGVERRPPGTVAPLPARGSSTTLARLQSAAQEGRRVHLTVVGRDGNAVSRLVEPRRVDRGRLMAKDSRSDAVRTYGLHEVLDVREVEPSA